MYSKYFRLLYKVLVQGFYGGFDINFEREKEGYINVAVKNKVLLQLLRNLNIRDEIRLRQEFHFRSFLKNLKTVSEVLTGLDYAFIKLYKPVSYVPADIDILLNTDNIKLAVSRLRENGFRVIVKEPYCITMSRNSIILDLYTYPTVGNIIYMDGVKLLDYIEKVYFHGIKIPVLERNLEAILAASHAIYKERIYTLNDYITVKKWLDKNGLRLAEEFKCVDAVKYAFVINEMVDKGLVTLPYIIPIAIWIRILASKIVRDNLTSSTLPYFSESIKDRRIGRAILNRLTRESY